MLSKKLIAYIKLIMVVLLWGGVYHVAKYLVVEANVATVAFMRFIVATICLFVPYYLKHRGKCYQQLRQNWILFLSMGIFGSFLYMLCFFGAETLIDADQIALIYAFAPCITILLSVIILKQKITLRILIGVIIALLGTVAVLNLANPDCGKVFCLSMFTKPSFGQFLALLAAVCMAFYSVLNKQAVMKKINTFTSTTYSIMFATLGLFINYLFFGDPVTKIMHLSSKFWLGILFCAVLATSLAYKWYNDAIEQIEVPKVAVFLNCLPFATILLGLLFCGHMIDWKELVAGIVIVLGVIITI